jgi:phosphatidylinositol-4,5-bisphosphate 4-phosphatase
MGLGLDSFRQVGTGSIEREIKFTDDNSGLRKSGVSRLTARLQGWWNGKSGDDRQPLLQQQKIEGRLAVKQEFFNLLAKTEGEEGARRALQAASLPDDWLENDRPLTNRLVSKILDTAQELRLDKVNKNENTLREVLDERGIRPTRENRDLFRAYYRAVQSHPDFGGKILSGDQVRSLLDKVDDAQQKLRAGQCRERFPGLSALVKNADPENRNKGGRLPLDSESLKALSQVPLDPRTLLDDLSRGKGGIGKDYPLLEGALPDLNESTRLLGKTAWSLDDLKDLKTEVDGHAERLRGMKSDLDLQREVLHKGYEPMVKDKFALEARLEEATSDLSDRLDELEEAINQDLSEQGRRKDMIKWPFGSVPTLEQQVAQIRQRIDSGTVTDPRIIDEIAQIEAGLADPLVGSLKAQIKDLDTKIEKTQGQFLVLDALGLDLDTQIQLLQNKSEHITDLAMTHPLSDRSLKLDKLIGARTGLALLDEISERVNSGELVLTEAQDHAFTEAQAMWLDRIDQLTQEYQDSGYDNLQSIPAPGKHKEMGLNEHPIVESRKAMRKDLGDLLKDVLPKDELKRVLSKSAFAKAESTALSNLDGWQPLQRNMVVMRDGVQRVYKSELIPAGNLHPSLAPEHGYGTSAGVTDSEDHARNLKVSLLKDPGGKTMTTMIGHGVLDMWNIEDPVKRQEANDKGAKEVLEVALSTNDRIRTELLREGRDDDAPPPRLVHVSVNLISPDSLRNGVGPKAYREKDFTFNQFRAFENNSGEKDLRLFHTGEDGEKESTEVRVDVDPITFSFGINAISTGGREKLMRVWDNVYEHNRENMVKFVGDLGNTKDGGVGSVGARPGGFIGDVYDRLESHRGKLIQDRSDFIDTVKQNAKDGKRMSVPGSSQDTRNKKDIQQSDTLMAQLRDQTDLVRQMFNSEDFRSGKGDPAKMGREILVLQGLAEQCLDFIGATDLGGTMSKGCKSDKDRGGVTDVEVKSKLILRDMGGDMDPNHDLVGDDQGVYYTVSSSSGQLENQQWNTGLMGSKEAGHLERRIPDPEVRQYLSGLGKFAKA